MMAGLYYMGMNVNGVENIMNNNQHNNNFTSLVNIKWTKHSMLKVHKMMWDTYIDAMLHKHQANYDEEVIRRINESYNWIKHIRKLCNKNEIAFKKKEDKKKIKK